MTSRSNWLWSKRRFNPDIEFLTSETASIDHKTKCCLSSHPSTTLVNPARHGFKVTGKKHKETTSIFRGYLHIWISNVCSLLVRVRLVHDIRKYPHFCLLCIIFYACHAQPISSISVPSNCFGRVGALAIYHTPVKILQKLKYNPQTNQ